MTDKTELLANIETATRERDQISRLADILLKRLVLKTRSFVVAVIVLVSIQFFVVVVFVSVNRAF